MCYCIFNITIILKFNQNRYLVIKIKPEKNSKKTRCCKNSPIKTDPGLEPAARVHSR